MSCIFKIDFQYKTMFSISRYNIIRNVRHPTTILANFSFSDDSSIKDKQKSASLDKQEKKDDKNDSEKNETLKRLNELLSMMSTDTDVSIIKNIAKPRSAAEKKAKRMANTVDNDGKVEKPLDIGVAAKKLAESIGGDTKKTESELLAILLKSDETKGDQSLSSLIGGMKIDNSQNASFERRSDFVRRSLTQKPFQRNNDRFPPNDGYTRPKRNQRDIQQSEISSGSVDLFGGKPLNIFTNADDLTDSPDILPTWSYLHQRELKLAITHPPKNYFEKMALWTEQDKLWKFPIDNEQGMDDEAKNFFTEHIFLEKHLESWCPTKGPVRHFMELVCVGLSKNPYFTVTQKKEHIEWFRDYFAEKKELLESVIVDANTPKELEK